mmetsp:Transcript_19578/g.66054  ORF Transcript_19578/g.66054 Transcript_19578/m.66054 type:complete len:210 (-) Transcript_19578:356-985(-)
MRGVPPRSAERRQRLGRRPHLHRRGGRAALAAAQRKSRGARSRRRAERAGDPRRRVRVSVRAARGRRRRRGQRRLWSRRVVAGLGVGSRGAEGERCGGGGTRRRRPLCARRQRQLRVEPDGGGGRGVRTRSAVRARRRQARGRGDRPPSGAGSVASHLQPSTGAWAWRTAAAVPCASASTERLRWSCRSSSTRWCRMGARGRSSPGSSR